ncbi:hypothetical protein JCM10213v2_002734 [Rhodosporidiobolus nylandii]
MAAGYATVLCDRERAVVAIKIGAAQDIRKRVAKSLREVEPSRWCSRPLLSEAPSR